MDLPTFQGDLALTTTHNVSSCVADQRAKRKRMVLYDKLQIIQRLENGENHRKIANDYGIGRSTVTQLGRNKSQLLSFMSMVDAQETLWRKAIRLKDSTKEVPLQNTCQSNNSNHYKI